MELVFSCLHQLRFIDFGNMGGLSVLHMLRCSFVHGFDMQLVWVACSGRILSTIQ